MKTLLLALLLAGCDRKPEGYYYSETVEYPDGTIRTRTFSGPTLPKLPLTPEAGIVVSQSTSNPTSITP